MYISTTMILIFSLTSFYAAAEEQCDESCSNIYDPVCGEALAFDGSLVIKKFHNVCYLNKVKCKFKYTDVQQIPNSYCGIRKESPLNSRRVHDFSIVGAHQACNHTCPTFCLDTYEPACAQIWSPNMQSYTYRPMINHCHIDLFSCVMGVNVTIQPLIGKCYKNPTALMFMFHIASLKTLKLLDEPSPASPLTKLGLPATPKRRFDSNFVENAEYNDFISLISKRS